MAGTVAFVLVVGLALSQSSSLSACPQGFECPTTKENDITVNCRSYQGNFPESWPKSTTKLNFSNCNITVVNWSSLDALSSLTELNLDGNAINCNCEYYKYWEQRHSKVKLTGQCQQPDKRRGKSLADAGRQMADECKNVSTPTPQPVTTVAQGVAGGEKTSVRPVVELLHPSTVSIPETTTVTVMAVMPAPPPPPSSIDHSSATATVASSEISSSTAMTSSSIYVPQPATMPKTTTTRPTTTELPTTTEEPTTTAAPPPPTTQPPRTTKPTTTETPTTTEEPTTIAPPPPPTTQPSRTAKPTTTETPTTTEEPTTTPPVPGPPVIFLYQLNPELEIGSVAHVICEVGGFPKPTVRMIFNGQDSRRLNKFRILNNGAKITFEVKYESEVICYASNRFGRRKAVLRVAVKDESTSFMILNMKLREETYVKDYEDKSSAAFQNLQQKIKNQLNVVFTEFPGFYGASLVKVSPGSVVADVLVKSSNSTKDRAMKVLEKEFEDAKFGSIPVDRYLFSIKTTRACAGTYLNTTWSDMVINGTAFEKCPREAKGMARRNCTEQGWYYPDYTHCKSEPITKARLGMELAVNGSEEAPNMKILSTLEEVKYLTEGNEEYSQMAGELITCVEILEKLANYTKYERNDIAFNDEEVKLFVEITSNLLIKYNEQEFIVSQKLVQTASTLIRVVEQYGLQAAITVSNGTEDLSFFIEENVVMGVGIIEPLKITKDVTFPNYDIPEVSDVRSVWKSSSFIVIDKETIEEMYKVKRFKVAGFLYKTLTRILSAESAYSMVGQGFEINSAVVALSTEPKLNEPFKKPVIIASNNLDPVELDGDSPICAFWDFNLNSPHGGWSEKGCWYTHYNTQNTTCLCNHLTNFAVLREKPVIIYAEQRSTPIIPPFLLCILIGSIIMICFCGITLFLLLLVAWRMKPDRTWAMHMFVCATLIVAFALIIVGLYTYNDVVFCRLLSILVHYFFLCAFTWIMAEATYMHVWSSNEGTKKRYWIGYFFIGFVPAGIPMAVAWVINGTYNFESPLSCWMSLFPSLIWVFFVPAVIYTLITITIFRQVWKSATGQLRVSLKALYWRTRFRVHVRYCIALLILFILIWLLGVLVISYHLNALLKLIFCILFIACCAITGLIIFIFYVILDRQFDDGIRECCCYCCRGRRGKYQVKGDDYWEDGAQPPVEREETMTPQEEPLIEPEEIHPPIIAFVTRPPPQSEPSMSSIDDPLYERVRKPGEEPPIKPEEEEKPPEAEPVYAKVRKSKTPEEQEEDPFPVVHQGSPRFLRGLTRQEVIRMAKKSDADKVELKKYESPKGSTDDIAEHPTYLLNQQEIDEELRHFRTFFAEGKPRPSSTSKTPPGTPTPSPIPRTQSASSSTSSTTRTKRVVKKKTKKSTTSATSDEKSDTTEKKSVLSFESFESSSTVSHEKTTTRAVSPPRKETLPEPEKSESPPPPPPRAANLLDDDDDDDDERKEFLKDTKKTDDKDDDSLTDVSADDLDRDDSDEEQGLLDGSRPTAV